MKKIFLTSMLSLSLLMVAGIQVGQAEGTYRNFFGQGNGNVDQSVLDTQDERDAGALNQGWDGGTGRVVPRDANTDVPDVPAPTPVDADE